MIQALLLEKRASLPIFLSCLRFLADTRRDGESTVREYMPYLIKRAQFLGSRFSYVPGVRPDDLLSAGMEGVLEACAAYTGSLSVPFDIFVKLRVRWAMLNEVRHIDPVTRSSREFRRHFDRVVWRLEQTLGRPAATAEVAEVLGRDVQELHAELCEQLAGSPKFVAEPEEYDDETECPGAPATRVEGVEEQVLGGEVWERAEEILKDSPQMWWRVIEMYFRDGCTLHEIGAKFGVSKQRISQIKERALREIRKKLICPGRAGHAG